MRQVFKIAGLAGMLFLVSCRNYTTTSEVQADGSIQRTIQVESDSGAVFTGAYPVPNDSTWQIVRNPSKDDSNKIVYSATKFYPSVAALNRDLEPYNDTLSYLQISVRIDRHFRWFNTYLTYHEIYHALNLFTALPMEAFLTEDELAQFAARDTSEEFGDRMNAWQEASMYEEIYQGLEKAVAANPMSGITSQQLAGMKDSLRAVAEDSVSLDDRLIDEILSACRVVFPYANLELLRIDLTENLSQFSQKMDLLNKLGSDSFKLNVVMPGLIIGTNADGLEGNTALWTVESDSMLYREFDAWVESRVINSGLLFGTLIFLGLLFSISTGLWIYRVNKSAKSR